MPDPAAPAPVDSLDRATVLSDPDHLDRLRDDLHAARFDATGVPALLGPSANRALGRGELFPALRVTGGGDVTGSPLATLVRLFLLGADAPVASAAAALPRAGLDRSVAAGLLERDGDRIRAALDLRPHAADGDEYLVVSDLDSDVRPGPVRHDHVLGIGAASITLANAVIRRPVGRALDVGTGCGIQSLHLAEHAAEVTATDVNPRALALAAATARLSGQRWRLLAGSMFEPVADETFDLIVSNPPFVIGDGGQDYIYRDSGMPGDGLCQALVAGIPDHLAPGGTAQLLANWIVHPDTDWRERVGSWVAGTGCDAWVVQREVADPAEYVGLWLKDAGDTGPQAAAIATRWLDALDRQRVAGIGMGTITLRRSDTTDPSITLDELTEPGDELTGVEVDSFLARRDWIERTTDAALLAAPLSLSTGVLLEQRSIPGAEGWSPMLRMLRRPGGPGATLQVDEWGERLLAGCTGQLPLGVLVDLLSSAAGVSRDALAAAALPAIRVAVVRGLVHPVDQDGERVN
ncbi:DUF7782 domain-containing protein [Nakamurella leprariae]|uniref:DUF7782 domain-containing protein n=1 Tax=Nakamurella leprariae TaxID=2803911 RepID=UPI002E2D1B20|nr:methyltransferase [Nakamurella leprariae]